MLHLIALMKIAVALLAPSPGTPPPEFFGLSSTTMLSEEEEAAEAQQIGIGTVRANVEWGLVAPSGPCESAVEADWSHYDLIFRRAAEHHLQVLVDLNGNLGSCGDANAFPSPGTGNFTEYTSGFVPAVVARYGVGGAFWSENPSLPYDPVRTWEVWNEPNLPANNAGDVIDPPSYAQFLIATSNAIRAVDPTATVLLGGVAFDGAPSGSLQSIGGYLDDIYEHPSGYSVEEFEDAFAGVGIHPYAVSGSGPTFEFGGPAVSEARVGEARAALDSLGEGSYAEKSLWVTEIGWPTEFAPTPQITPAVQSAYLAETMAWLYAHSEADDIRYAAAFDYRDFHSAAGCDEPECWPQYAGLKRLEYLPSKSPPGGPAEAEYKVDRPIRCAYKLMISGTRCADWAAEELGGDTDFDPAISSGGPGRLEAFATGSDQRLYTRAWTQSGLWSEWAPLPGPTVASGPAAVSWEPERVDVVARLADGTVQHWSRVAGSWGEENLGGDITADPAIASWAPGRLDVFARGADGGLDHTWWEAASGWSPWERLPGPAISSSPAAVASAAGHLDVVADTAGGSVEHWTYEDGQWTAEGIGGAATSAPAVAAGAPNRLEVFVRGAGGALEQESWDPTAGWSGWAKVPGVKVASGPAAVAWNANRLDLVADLAGGGVEHWYSEG
ncbi:MAG TPA: hypothetical protein VH299_06745 [Solirubrobacterales bacterium]|jgi:hypothetical protein|nr:hypothetical protein [Solirubrobacterales bacterium]